MPLPARSLSLPCISSVGGTQPLPAPGPLRLHKSMEILPAQPAASQGAPQTALSRPAFPGISGALSLESLPPAKLLDTLSTARRENRSLVPLINARIERLLKTADLSRQVPFKSRYNNSLYKIEGSEIPIVMKRMQSPKAAFLEELAYRVSEKLGVHLVPPTIARKRSILQPLLEGYTEEKKISASEKKVRGVEIPGNAKLFYYLVNQLDDNQGNRMWSGDATLMLIDHENTFSPRNSATHEGAIRNIRMDEVFTDETWRRFLSIPASEWRALCHTEHLSLSDDAIAGFLARIEHVKHLAQRQIESGAICLSDPSRTAARAESILREFELRAIPRADASFLAGDALQILEAGYQNFLKGRSRIVEKLKASRDAALEPLLQEIKSLRAEAARLKPEKTRLKSELSMANRTGFWNWVRVKVQREPELEAERSYREIKSSLKHQERRIVELENRLGWIVDDYRWKEDRESDALRRSTADGMRHALLEKGVYVEEPAKENDAVERFLNSREASKIIDRSITSRFGLPDREKSIKYAVKELRGALAQQPFYLEKRRVLQQVHSGSSLNDDFLTANVSAKVTTYAQRCIERRISDIRRESIFAQLARENAEFDAKRAQRAEEGEALRIARWKADQEAFASRSTRANEAAIEVKPTPSRAAAAPISSAPSVPATGERSHNRKASISSSMIDREIEDLRASYALHGEGSITTEASDLARNWIGADQK